MSKAFFLTIEGGEGVGKSLFTSGLAKRLGERGISLVTTREPGGTPVAQAIRQLFLAPPADDPLLPDTELFLVSAARCQHVGRKILPALRRGEWVICDRFFDSTRVYQGAMGGVDAVRLETLIAHSVEGLSPDLTFLLDCDVDTILARIAGREALGGPGDNRFDAASRDYHEGLRRAYLDVARRFPERIVVLDARRPPESVVDDAMTHIDRRLSERRP